MKGQILQKACMKSAVCIKKHSSTILTCIGAVGVVATAVFAVRETPKALKLIEDASDKKGEKLTVVETVTTAAPAYIPAAVIGASTIVCIFGANVLNKRQQAALTSAYALVENSYKRYQNKLKELYGEEADSKIRQAIAKDIYIADPPFISPDNGLEDVARDQEKVLFYEEYANRYFESSILEVQAAEYHLNRNYSMRGCADLNEFYEFLGLPETDYGATVGWSMSEGYYWIDFEHKKVTMDDGLEVYIIGYTFAPVAGFDEDY